MLAYYGVNCFNQVLEEFHQPSEINSGNFFLLGGRHGNKTIPFHAVPPLSCFSPPKFGYAEITSSYISMTWYPGNPKPCQLNNTQWRTRGWWKLRGSFDKIAPVSLWTASVEIMMALVRGIQEVQKGFLWLWKRMAAQGAVTSFLFRDGLLCLLFICGQFLWGLWFYCL